MTEKKSLLARFDEEHIIKVATSPDDPERLFVDFTDSDGKMVGVKSLSVNGGYNYPKMHVKLINNSASAVNFLNAYIQSEYGMASELTSIGVGETKDFDLVYLYDPTQDDWQGYYANFATTSGYPTGTDLVNCKVVPTHRNIFTIGDPSLDSAATITLT